MRDIEKVIQAALDAGAFKAAVIPRSEIVLSASFWDVCKSNSCGNFGKCWVCPPDAGEIGALMEKVRSFEYGLLYQSVAKIEDSFDFEGMQAGAAEHAQISQRVQGSVAGMLPKNIFHLSGGGCHLCETCAKREEMPCVYPDKALLPMEACGIDVYSTAKETGLKYINGQNTVTYFGIILFSEE